MFILFLYIYETSFLDYVNNSTRSAIDYFQFYILHLNEKRKSRERHHRNIKLPSVSTEFCRNFFECFIFSFWNFLVRKDPEEREERAEWKKRIIA